MEQKQNIIIHLWCCPRTLSTATLYSFSRRPDTIAIDEPLYAHYLDRNPELSRPYREKLLQEHNKRGAEVLQQLSTRHTAGKNIIVCKHITKQLEGIDRKHLFGANIKHVFLIRDPLDCIISWNDRENIHQEGCNMETLCFPQMVQLFSEIRSHTKTLPIVVDSNLLKRNPREILVEVCSRLSIPFFEEQLSWPAGPKPEVDGYVNLYVVLDMHVVIL